MNILIALLPVLGVLALLFGFGFGMAYMTRKRRYVEQQSAVAAFEKTTADLQKALKEQSDIMLTLATAERQGMSGVMPKGDTVRVYAALLAKGLETRLVAVPAQTFEDMVALVTEQYGMGWLIAASCYLDMEVSKKEPAPAPEKAETNPQAAEVFVHQLEFARESFAGSPFERRALTAVINRIKKRYDLDHTTA